MKKNWMPLILFMTTLAGSAYAQKTTGQATWVNPNSFNINMGLGLGYMTGMRIGGGLEYGLGKFILGNKVPFTYGIAVRTGLSLVSTPVFSTGVFGTLHFSWGALNPPNEIDFIGHFESYLGLGVLVVPYVDFDSIGGLSYYFSKNVALNLEAGIRASYIGLLFNL